MTRGFEPLGNSSDNSSSRVGKWSILTKLQDKYNSSERERINKLKAEDRRGGDKLSTYGAEKIDKKPPKIPKRKRKRIFSSSF